jgi:enoyl-[acyl-carrier protein] reductase II
MHMVPTLADAVSAAEAGADVIVAQGTEGGGHVGLVSSVVIVPQVARAVAPVPVLAAGGFADGAGLAAALALGAEGVLLGTRFLATVEAPVSDGYKQALISSDGHDTELSDVPDPSRRRHLARSPRSRPAKPSDRAVDGTGGPAPCPPVGAT